MEEHYLIYSLIQVQFEGDPASALVTFSDPSEAEAALSSPDAVMGNRFIKMFYHYERPQHQQRFPHPSQLSTSVKDRLGGAAAGKDGVQFEGDVLTKTISNEPEKTEEEKEAEAKAKSEEKAAVRNEGKKTNKKRISSLLSSQFRPSPPSRRTRSCLRRRRR